LAARSSWAAATHRTARVPVRSHACSPTASGRPNLSLSLPPSPSPSPSPSLSLSLSLALSRSLSLSLSPEDYVYTEQTAPIAWLAPEAFAESTRGRAGRIATTASDVFMLGGVFLELATRCTRTPYDWMTGFSLSSFRWLESTRFIGPVQAAVDADRSYQWSVNVNTSLKGTQQLAALLDVTFSCLSPEPGTTALVC
jgi:hypothetical protein